MVPASAGGGTDIIIRTLSEYITKETGQAVVISNVTGLTGYEQLRTSDPNGYNYGILITGMLISKAQGDLDFGHEAFDIVARTGTDTSTGIIVHKDSPYESIEDLINAIEQDKDSVVGGISMTGYPYLYILAMEESLDLDINYVDAGNTAERSTALLGKQVDFIISNAGSTAPYIESGDFRFLAVASEERDSFLPDVPTFKEKGYDFVFPGQSMYVAAPKGTDKEVIKQFSDIIVKLYENENLKEDLLKINVSPNLALNYEDAQKDIDETAELFQSYVK